MAGTCEHTDLIDVEQLPEEEKSGLECAACIEEGTPWVHLRQCLICGTIGCCDNSPRRHARKHAGEVEHPIIASAEPGERWRWCFVDQMVV